MDPCLYRNVCFHSVILSNTRLIPYLPEQARQIELTSLEQRVCVPLTLLDAEPLRTVPKTTNRLPLSIQVEAKVGTEVARSEGAINILHTELTEPLC